MIINNRNIELASDNVYTKLGLILMSKKGLKSVANLQKKKVTHHNPNVDLVSNQILTSINGHNSVTDLQNTTLYNPNIDVNVYTKFD